MNKSPSRNLHGLSAEILFAISLAFVGTCLAPEDAAAQTPSTPSPFVEDKRQQERKRSLRERQERGVDVRLPPARSSVVVRLPRDEAPCSVVSRLELQGESAARFGWSLDGAAGDGGDDPPTGRCLGAAGIDLVVARVQRSIVERGYITSLKANLKNALIDTAAAQGAFTIGNMSTGDAAVLDAFTNKVAHAIAGCAAGAARTDTKAGCGAGAIGAAVGEMAAEAYGRRADTTQFASMIGGMAAALAGADAQGIGVASQAGSNAAANNYLNHIRPSMLRLSEKEQYDAAVASCARGDQAACATRTELAVLSERRDQQLARACAGDSPALCNSLAKEAAAMGNVVYGSQGGLVYANSPTSSALNTSTIGPVTRPENFHDTVARSTSDAILVEAGNQVLGAAIGTAISGGKAIIGMASKTSAAEFVAPLGKSINPAADGVFGTQGLNRNPLDFPDGVMMVNALQSKGLSMDEAIREARSFINSGSTLPLATPLDVTDKLVKVVPSGGAPSANTGYWMKESQLEALKIDSSNLANKLGLPPGMQVTSFDVFQITPKQGAVVFESKIAPTTVDGLPNTVGGAIQDIVVDRSQFTSPVKTETILLKK